MAFFWPCGHEGQTCFDLLADLAAQNGPKIVKIFLKSSNFNIHGHDKLSDPVENKKRTLYSVV